MLINSTLDIIGTDICSELLEICVKKNLNVVQNDCCRMYLRDNIFDYALSVAVFHHMADTSRRNHALSEMIRILKVGGHRIFSVWSIETDQGTVSINDITSSHTINGLPAEIYVKTRQLITIIYSRDQLFVLGNC